MFTFCASKHGWGRAFLFTSLAFAASAHAQLLYPGSGKDVSASGPRMLDARVNAKDAFQRASAARPGSVQSGFLRARGQAQAITSAAARFQQKFTGAGVKFSNLTGAPRAIASGAKTLTNPAPNSSSESIVRNFLDENAALFGLTSADLGDLAVLGDSKGGSSGLRMLRMEQQLGGRPIFQSETRFLLKKDGSLTAVLGQLIPNAHALMPQIDWNSALSAPDAVAHLLSAANKNAQARDFSISSSDTAGRLRLAQTNDFVKGEITARQIYFPLAPGVLVPAWSLVVFTTGEQDWYAVVDAQTGDTLWRKNIRAYASAQDARFRVYVQADGVTPSPSPAPNTAHTVVVPGSGTQFPGIAPTIVSMHTAYDPAASPNGWIDDCPAGGCTANETQTLGNNALLCMDQNQAGGNADICDTAAATVIDGNGRPTGNPDANARNRDFLGTAPRDFQTGFLPPPQAGNPEAGQTATGNGTSGTAAIDQFRRGMITHLFYVTNWYHDRLYELGFDEASGNFQQTNFTGMGLGGDRVLGDADDGSGTNNANFSTPPDGTSGRMQMYRFTGPTIDRDGGLDAEVSMHEMTHGTSNRLVGNGAGLNWDPAGGMGEGWSDFVALSLLYNTNADDPNARYASGGYATYKLQAGYTDNYVYGIRRFPYSTDHSVNPMTWADVDDVTNNLSGGIAPSPVNFNGNGGMEVHNAGEIWALTLWGVRSRIIADAAGANGDVPTGNKTTLQLIIDGLKMTPIDPTFIDARDAILQADCSTNDCANEESIWGGFSDRGLGYGATAPYNVMVQFGSSHQGIHESFSAPFLDVVNPATDVVVNDIAGNHNAKIDPGEGVRLTVSLTNPWRSADKSIDSATGTLTTSTPGVTIYANTAHWGAIAAQGTVAANDAFSFTVAPSVACGSSIDFTLTTVSDLGTTSTTFSLRVGDAIGTDPVITYTSTPSPALAIPDGLPHGVFNQMNVADDFQIADLNFRLDSVTHGFDGDLTFMLRSPRGVGTDLVGLIAVTDPGGFGSTGANLTNMLIDDDLAITAANSAQQATSAQAPYTGSWLPEFNAPWTTLFGFPNPDPVGSLSRYDGTSTKGTWSVLAADYSTPDAGTLNAWSILVTPVHFACTAVTPSVIINATKTVAGRFGVGGTVVYTVTLTNNGSANQADNPGHEFSDVLPAALTLVSATASSGTPATSGNTVTWDGAIAPAGGAVTITITATVNPARPATISNQGTVSYDADGNGTNESTLLTDDPALPGAADPTVFAPGTASLTATKTVSGTFLPGNVVTYTIVVTNGGTGYTTNGSGDELLDVLPPELQLVSASATSGTTSVGINGTAATIHWNGGIEAGASVTLTIQARILAGTEGHIVSNQATINYDSDGSGIHDTTILTDDPAPPGASDPTRFVSGDEIFKDGFE
jgi:uncharacterized repeat protein (TIGR01451 family)